MPVDWRYHRNGSEQPGRRSIPIKPARGCAAILQACYQTRQVGGQRRLAIHARDGGTGQTATVSRWFLIGAGSRVQE